MKFIIAAAAILTLFSLVNCDEGNIENQENLRKFSIDLQYSEKILEVVKKAEQSAKELYERVQNEYDELIVGINNLKNHLNSMQGELTRIDKAHTIAFQNKDQAHTAATLAEENFQKAKEKLAAVKTSGDQEKINSATSEYTLHSREQLLSVDILKKAEEALDIVVAELDDIKMAVSTAKEAYEKALSQKESLGQNVTKLKAYLEEKINERMNAEVTYKKAKAAVEGLSPKKKVLKMKENGAGSLGIKQIVGFFCSLLTGAVATGLIL